MERQFLFEVDGQQVPVKEADVGLFKSSHPNAEPLQLRNVGGQAVPVRVRDLASFEKQNPDAERMDFIRGSDGKDRYVTRSQREKFIKTLPKEQRGKLSKQLGMPEKAGIWEMTKAAASGFSEGASESPTAYLGRGIAHGVADYAEMPDTLLRAGMEVAGADDNKLYRGLDKLERARRPFINATLGAPTDGTASKIAYGAGSFLPDAVAFAKVGPVLPALKTGTTTYNQLRSIGRDPVIDRQAKTITMPDASTQIGPEMSAAAAIGAGALDYGAIRAMRKFLPGGKYGIHGLVRGGGVGGTVGGVRKAAENVIARVTYDPERKIGEGVPESAAGGAAVGGVFGFVEGYSNAMRQRRAARGQHMHNTMQPQQKLPPPAGGAPHAPGASGLPSVVLPPAGGAPQAPGAGVPFSMPVRPPVMPVRPPVMPVRPPVMPVRPPAGSKVTPPVAAAPQVPAVTPEQMPAVTQELGQQLQSRGGMGDVFMALGRPWVMRGVNPDTGAVIFEARDTDEAIELMPDALMPDTTAVPEGSGELATVPKRGAVPVEQAEAEAVEQDAQAEKVGVIEGPKPEAKPGETSLENVLYGEREITQVPVDEISVQMPGFEQFKQDADPITGEVAGQELTGRIVDLDMSPIVVLQKNDGSKVVVTGRHRLAMFKRQGRKTIPSRVIYESEGVTPEMARVIDATSNILDEKGTISDYIKFFRELEITEEGAKPLLSRPSAKTAYSIYRDASPVTQGAIDFDGTRDGGITPEQAGVIAHYAPLSESLSFGEAQAMGVRAARGGMKPRALSGYMQALVRNARIQAEQASRPQAAQMDMFENTEWDIGDADSIASREGVFTQAKAREYRDLRATLSNAVRKPDSLVLTDEQAAVLGITDAANKEQLVAAWDEADRLAKYWEKGLLELDDVIAMRNELGISTEGLTPEAAGGVAEDADGYVSQADVAGGPDGGAMAPGARGAEQGTKGGNFRGQPRVGLMLEDAMELAELLGKGKMPKVVQRIRAMGGQAAGVFKFRPGKPDSGKIELRADTALIVSKAERFEIAAQARQQAELELGSPDDTPEAKLAFETRQAELAQEMLGEAFERNVLQDPEVALKVLSHEVGHWIDFLPEGLLKRGNIFGHIAALNNYTKKMMGMDPHGPGPLTKEDRADLMKQARAEAKKRNSRVVIDEIVREVPEYKVIGVTSDDVLSLLGIDAGKSTPELYNWFAVQPTPVKKSVLLAAMKGAVDARAAKFDTKVQVGTKTVRTTVERKVDPVDVKDVFKRLLREEVEKRRLVELNILKRELEGLIAWNNNSLTMPEYYSEPSEMFADAFGAWLNYPLETAERAPIFNTMMEEWIAARPEVAKHYLDLQKRLENPQDTSSERWKAMGPAMKESSIRQREARENARKLTRTELRDQTSATVLRIMNPVYRRMKLLEDAEKYGKIMQSIGDARYSESTGEWIGMEWGERVFKRLKREDVSMEDFDVHLLARRIAFEGVRTMRTPEMDRGRANLYNPRGFTPRSATAFRADYKAKFPDKFAAMEKAALGIVRTRETVLFPIAKRTNVISKEQLEMITENWAYGKFAVDRTGDSGSLIEKMMKKSGNLGGGIKHQIGTVRMIGGVAENTLSGDVALARWMETEYMKGQVIDGLLAVAKDEIQPSRTRVIGGRVQFVDVDTPRVKTIRFQRGGKVFAYDVPTSIANALGRTSEGTGNVLSRIVAGYVSGQAQVLTGANMGFGLGNPHRDAGRTSQLHPGGLYLPIIGLPEMWYFRATSILPALRRFAGIYDEQVVEALSRHLPKSGGSYNIDDAYDNPELLGPVFRKLGLKKHLDPIERLRAEEAAEEGGKSLIASLKRAGIHTPEGMAKASLKAAEAVWKAWNVLTGVIQITETMEMLAGMKRLDWKFGDGMPEWKKQRIVHKFTGTPDINERSHVGRSAGFRMFSLFWDINKEAGLTNLEAQIERPVEQAWRRVVGAIPAIITAMAAENAISRTLRWLSGAFKDTESDEDSVAKSVFEIWADQIQDWEDMQKCIPFRDRVLYNAVAYRWIDKKEGKVEYFRFIDDQANGAVRAIGVGLGETLFSERDISDVLEVGFDDATPILSPPFVTVIGLLTGKDASFGFRDIVSDRNAVHSERGRVNNVKEYAKWVYNNATGGTLGLYRFGLEDDPYGADVTGREDWLRSFGVGTLHSKFVRVSNRGIKERHRMEDDILAGVKYDYRLAVDAYIAAGYDHEKMDRGLLNVFEGMPPDTREEMIRSRSKRKSMADDLTIHERREIEASQHGKHFPERD